MAQIRSRTIGYKLYAIRSFNEENPCRNQNIIS